MIPLKKVGHVQPLFWRMTNHFLRVRRRLQALTATRAPRPGGAWQLGLRHLAAALLRREVRAPAALPLQLAAGQEPGLPILPCHPERLPTKCLTCRIEHSPLNSGLAPSRGSLLWMGSHGNHRGTSHIQRLDTKSQPEAMGSHGKPWDLPWGIENHSVGLLRRRVGFRNHPQVPLTHSSFRPLWAQLISFFLGGGDQAQKRPWVAIQIGGPQFVRLPLRSRSSSREIRARVRSLF